MLAALAAIAARLDTAGVRWRVAGSTGRLLLGHPVRPDDVDLEVAGVDAGRAAAALGLAGPTYQTGGGWSSRRAGGAIGGVLVDLSGGLEITGPGGLLRADDAATVSVVFGGHVVQVVTPGESLARALVAGDAEREVRARGAIHPSDTDALRYAQSRIAAAVSAAR